MRKMFDLCKCDKEFLDKSNYDWEAIIENGGQWILIRNFPVCEGYNHQTVDIAIKIEASYPDANLDMVYVNPHLALINKKNINKIDIKETINGKEWQRWSRHYDWDPNTDNLETHILCIQEWFVKETST